MTESVVFLVGVGMGTILGFTISYLVFVWHKSDVMN